MVRGLLSIISSTAALPFGFSGAFLPAAFGSISVGSTGTGSSPSTWISVQSLN
jgi:hypothetical protein